MKTFGWLAVAVLAAAYVLGPAFSQENQESPYSWQTYDMFDEVMDIMDEVNAENCASKPESKLYLPKDSVSQVPRYNRLLSSIIYPNRTNLLHLHNMALNRAFFYSYISQRLNTSEIDFPMQPGLMYYYFSAAADVSANEYFINGSSVYYDNNGTYANWYRNLPFNETLALFGPRAYRFDDYNDPTNWLREPTNRTIDILDYGAGPQSNYTLNSYKLNQWYKLFLPDDWDSRGLDSVRKNPYDFKIKYSNGTGSFLETEDDEEGMAYTFYGPPSPGQNEIEHMPVSFTQPYFDCGRSNKWIVSAVSPVVDYIPRYLEWKHIRRFQYTAVTTMDIDFLSIDYNPCPHFGRDTPSIFQGTSRCKEESTMCEPLHGWGFRRGGYQCVCRPGYRYPHYQRGPFQGSSIETATADEYENGFECLPVGLRMVIPIIRGNETGTPTEYASITRKKRETAKTVKLHPPPPNIPTKRERRVRVETTGPSEPLQSRILKKKTRLLRLAGLEEAVREEKNGAKRMHIVARKEHHPQQLVAGIKSAGPKQKLVPRYKRSSHHRQKRQAAFDQEAWDRMNDILEHKDTVTRHNCHTYINEELELPGDVSYGVEEQFGNEARVALRLAHFLSNFLQNIDRFEEYGNLRGDALLNIEQIFGEVLANVMGDLKIKGSGVFFDIDKFEGPDGERRQFFGPFAYRYNEDTGGQEGERVNTQYRAVDFAGFPDNYLDYPWFRAVKERWQSNTYGLTKFTEKPMIRSDLQGRSLRKFEIYPLYYYAPSVEDGWWSAPYFDCDGFYKDWIVTYSVPFFGLNDIRSNREFKGVVMVNMRLGALDINQCPQEYWVPNAFKATARCDYDTTYCEYLPSRGFVRGSYKCECRQGFEYPFNDRAWYYDGQTMEEEYRKLMAGEPSRYYTLKCRIAGAASNVASIATIVTLLFVYIFNTT